LSSNWNLANQYASVYSNNSAKYVELNFLQTNFIRLSSVDTQLNTNSTNVVQNSAVASRIIAIENSLNVLAPAPTYTQPSASLTNFNPNIFEVGSNVSRTLTVSYNQNDGGSPTNFQISKGATVLYNGSVSGSITVNETAQLGTTTYSSSVTHLSGAVKLNVLGLPDSRGVITAGTKTTSQSYNAFYREFFGSVVTIPTNLRDLTGNRLTNDSSVYNLYAYYNTNVIVIPTNRNLVSIIVQASNEDVTLNFINSLSSVNVNDAGGTARSYKRYSYTSALPFNSNLRITIS
jgi:hypothetical protein